MLRDILLNIEDENAQQLCRADSNIGEPIAELSADTTNEFAKILLNYHPAAEIWPFNCKRETTKKSCTDPDGELR